MKRRIKYSGAIAAAVAIVCSGLAVGLAGSSAPAVASGRSLVMESSPETAITQDFNPYTIPAAPYGMGATGLIYEPLIQFDLAAPPKQYKWLATGYKWSNGGRAITFTIRKGVKWNNGAAMTPQDVAFTFELVKANPAINLGGLDISTVKVSGDDVTVTFPSAQFSNLENIAGLAIVPKAIWSKVGNPATFVDPNPVGTGPEMLATFTPQGFTLKENTHYWQKAKIKVPSVYFPVYTTNQGAATALFSGQIDWTGNFIVGLQKDFVATSPKYHHYWEAPGSTNSLEPNLNKWPTNQLPVRQAISLAVNRTVLADEGEAGLEDPVLNATGLTLPTFAAWSKPVKSLVNSATAQPAAARKVLEKAGFKLNSSGWFEKGGKVVSITLISPSSYSDYAAVGSLVAGELQKAGIEANFDGISVSAWNQDVADGNFQVSEHWANGGLTPFNMYNGWLNSALATSSATGDYERLHSAAINADLARLEGASSTAQQTRDLAPIEKFVAANLPIIPVTTASEWFEYNSQNFVGFPTQKTPYETGQPSGTNNGPGSGTDEVVLLHLSPRK